MPAEWRNVELAPGHALRLRRSRAQTGVAGKITVESSRRGRFDIDLARWCAAPLYPNPNRSPSNGI